jgi:Membrane-associated lipoprotein involved in thiamine biosynthesis
MYFRKTFNRSPKIEEAQSTTYIMGTIAQLKVFGENAESVVDLAIDRLNEIDDKLSVFKKYSEISRVNANAGGVPLKVSGDTFFLLDKSLKYSELLNGTFDPTIRSLVDLWAIGSNGRNIPDEKDIQEKLKLVNYKDIILDYSGQSVLLKHKCQSVDLGSIAKGYASDEVRDIFIRNNIKSALIDLGGNIYVLGNKVDGALWNVGIQDPLKQRGEFVGVLSLRNKSIVTSGNYEKYFEREGKRYHHIIDPRNGYPSENNLMSATIISDDSLDGDGLSTGVYILGIEKTMELIKTLKGIDAIFITNDKKVYATPEVKNNFKLTNSSYTFVDNY